jgi:hypothetical protein
MNLFTKPTIANHTTRKNSPDVDHGNPAPLVTVGVANQRPGDDTADQEANPRLLQRKLASRSSVLLARHKLRDPRKREEARIDVMSLRCLRGLGGPVESLNPREAGGSAQRGSPFHATTVIS